MKQPDWLRESFQKLADDCPTLKAGIVHCSKCLTERKVDVVECMLTGWPECHGETMSLGVAGEVEPIRLRPDFKEERAGIVFMDDPIGPDATEEEIKELENNFKKCCDLRHRSSFAKMGDRMATGPGYEDWRTRESGEDSRKYLDETEGEK